MSSNLAQGQFLSALSKIQIREEKQFEIPHLTRDMHEKGGKQVRPLSKVIKKAIKRAGLLARKIGFKSPECGQIEIAVSDIVKNVAYHSLPDSSGGIFWIRTIEDPKKGVGIELSSENTGVITDLESLSFDFDPSDLSKLLKTTGRGLFFIAFYMGELEIESGDQRVRVIISGEKAERKEVIRGRGNLKGKTRVVARKWKTAQQEPREPEYVMRKTLRIPSQGELGDKAVSDHLEMVLNLAKAVGFEGEQAEEIKNVVAETIDPIRTNSSITSQGMLLVVRPLDDPQKGRGICLEIQPVDENEKTQVVEVRWVNFPDVPLTENDPLQISL